MPLVHLESGLGIILICPDAWLLFMAGISSLEKASMTRKAIHILPKAWITSFKKPGSIMRSESYMGKSGP